MPTPRSDRRALNARIPNPEFADVEAIAKREECDRTFAVRLCIAYASRFMPKGWRPNIEETSRAHPDDHALRQLPDPEAFGPLLTEAQRAELRDAIARRVDVMLDRRC